MKERFANWMQSNKVSAIILCGVIGGFWMVLLYLVSGWRFFPLLGTVIGCAIIWNLLLLPVNTSTDNDRGGCFGIMMFTLICFGFLVEQIYDLVKPLGKYMSPAGTGIVNFFNAHYEVIGILIIGFFMSAFLARSLLDERRKGEKA